MNGDILSPMPIYEGIGYDDDWKIGKFSEDQIHFSDIILDSITFIIKVRHII